MANAILVINAGSSSVKFSLFLERNQQLSTSIRGQVEGLYTAARFVSKTPEGTVKAVRT